MGKGRKRTPVEQKLVRGTFRKDRVAENMPDPIPGEPCFPGLASPAESRWFSLLVAYMQGENRGTRSDELVLRLAAQRMAEIEELDAIITVEGPTYENAGLKKVHPAVKQRSESMRHLQSLLAELGLTPASRSKVSAEIQSKPANEWADAGFDSPTVQMN